MGTNDGNSREKIEVKERVKVITLSEKAGIRRGKTLEVSKHLISIWTVTKCQSCQMCRVLNVVLYFILTIN